MLTVLLILIPFIAGLLLVFSSSQQAGKIALGASIAEFIVALFAATQFQHSADMQFVFNKPWIASLGIHFNVAMDGISLLLVLLTTFLVPIIILSSFNNTYTKPSLFYALILFMQMALVGVFVAMDGFLFYIFWELALIPIYFICLLWGGDNRAKITFKFFIYTILGSLLMLVSLVYLYLHGKTNSFEISELYKAGASLAPAQQSLVFVGIFIAFAIKMPVFPFHTWQPDTYTVAPTQGTMLLSGIMLKMGTYGLIRWLLPMVPQGLEQWSSVVVALSVIGIVYTSCIAIVQKDYKRLIAYSSIAHVGLIAAGILSCNIQGIQGSVIQMLSHGVNVVGLFFIVDIIQRRTQTRYINELGGIRNVEPVFAVLFLIVLLGSVALPLTNGFIGEFLLINGVYQYGTITAIFAGLTIILGAVYMLRSYQGIMLGELKEATKNFAPLNSNEKLVLIIICAAILVFGIYPKPLLDIAEPSVVKLVGSLQSAVR